MQSKSRNAPYICDVFDNLEPLASLNWPATLPELTFQHKWVFLNFLMGLMFSNCETQHIRNILCLSNCKMFQQNILTKLNEITEQNIRTIKEFSIVDIIIYATSWVISHIFVTGTNLYIVGPFQCKNMYPWSNPCYPWSNEVTLISCYFNIRYIKLTLYQLYLSTFYWRIN